MPASSPTRRIGSYAGGRGAGSRRTSLQPSAVYRRIATFTALPPTSMPSTYDM
jgi:hypothetical protein